MHAQSSYFLIHLVVAIMIKKTIL